jgi:hypothetical protein
MTEHVIIEEQLDVMDDLAIETVEHMTPAEGLVVALGWLVRRPDEPREDRTN